MVIKTLAIILLAIKLKENSMKSYSKAAVIGTALMSSSSAFAVDIPELKGVYYHAQLMYTQIDVSNADGSGTANSPAFGIELGKIIYPNNIANIFLEGVFIMGVEDDSAFTYSSEQERYTAGINTAFGLQVKIHRQFAKRFAGYITLGAINVTVDVTPESYNFGTWGGTTTGTPASDTSTELTYALGFEFNLSQSSAITFTYGNLYSGTVGSSTVDVSNLNIGFKSLF